ncbi:ATP-binding protein [Serratia fonticola]|uniref:ATP-binding protein n=1 Tax=Serratia fonticola TaxID=47917 RepID=UPI0024DE4D5D|nr:ATP-binding protein [Serratia fonticola]MDK2375294.1 ATP-binding protein [Serratia fonticola]
MGIPVLILGDSGSGKSASMMKLKPDDGFLINPENKRLPFKSSGWKARDFEAKTGNVFFTDIPADIVLIINFARRAGKKFVVVDDFQYVMGNQFMRRRSEKSFEKFTEIGGGAWDVIRAAQAAEEDLIVYFLAHTEETPSGRIKMKTIGKMLDEKITVEGMFSIALRTGVTDSRYYFTTQSDGTDPVKSPIGLFDSFQIDNDLAAVDKAIRDYYELNME